jgi:hypothetical protein
MLNNYFQKSKPIQNVFIIILFSIIYITYNLKNLYINSSLNVILFAIINYFLLIATIIIIKFLINELSLAKSSNYFAMFFITFLCYFPSIMMDINLVIAVFLSTFSMYRFLKIDFSGDSKLAVFDACLFLFTAVIFHFWAIIYSVLIIAATLRNYKKNNNIFLIPLVAFITVFILFLLFSLIINPDWTKTVIQDSTINFNFYYFKNIIQRLAVSIFFAMLVLFFVLILTQITSKALLIQAALRKIFAWLFLSVFIFILSPYKSNDILFFTIIPLVIIASNYIEFSNDKILKEIFLITNLLLGIVFFTLQTFFI